MSNLINYLVLTLAACVLLSRGTRGQFIYGGKCPKHPLQPNFDISKYMGTWYEIGRTVALFELGYKCFSSEYKLMEEGKMVAIVNSGINFMKHKVSKGGKGMVDPHRPARLMVKIGKSPFWSNYNVLKTDYENYAIVWNCGNLAWVLHTEILWILSRKQTLPAQSWTEINDYLKKYKVRTRTFSMTKQSNCDFDFYS